jgi:hypothetical protein
MTWALTPTQAEAAFWVILTAGLAAGIGMETDWGRQLELPVMQTATNPPPFAKPKLAEPFQLAASDQFSDITSRPLFIITRQPAPVAPTADSKPSMKKDQFILMGTTITGESKIAFLVEKAGNRSRVVAQGNEINGITVREVLADRIVLSQFDDTETLVLRTNKPPPVAPARPAVAQGVPPFFGDTAQPTGVQGVPPFIGAPGIAAPGIAAGAPGTPTPPPGATTAPAGAQVAPPPGRRAAFPGSPIPEPPK